MNGLLAWVGSQAMVVRTGDNMAQQPVRRRLLGLIKKNPGMHASELAREMEEPWGTVQYHLSLLRRAEMVHSFEAGRERRFYPSEIDPTKARLLTLFNQGRRPEIADFIQRNPGFRQVDICDTLKVSRKTFRSSVRPLLDEGLLEERRGLHANRYFPSAGLERVIAEAQADDGVGMVDMTMIGSTLGLQVR